MTDEPVLDPEEILLAAEELERLFRAGLRDPAVAFELCMREEHTRERIRTAPHQHVLFRFVKAHRTSVVRAFAGSSKTYCIGFLGLHELGLDPTSRGAFIGATAGSASKTLAIVREPIEDPRGEFPEVHLLFPNLRPTQLRAEPWGQQRITVDRPAGIRDPSFVALGEGSDLPGSRLARVLVDDLLDAENTATPAARDKLARNFGRKILTRLDVRDAWLVVANTPWEPDDLTFTLEKGGWATLSMEIEGEVRVTNTDWFPRDLLRPSRLVPGAYRLLAHDSEEYGAPLCEILPDGGHRKFSEGEDPESWMLTEHFDVDEQIPLWPERFGVEVIARLRDEFRAMPGEFMAKYKLRPRAPADEDKKRAWIEECKLNGRAFGVRGLSTSYRGDWPTFTGIDVATGVEEGSDMRAIFTFAQIEQCDLRLPDGRFRRLRNARLILNVQYGLWAGREFANRIAKELRDFDSIGLVENNSAQDLIRQWLVAEDAGISLEGQATGEINKHRRVHGVAGVLIELENLGWIIPTDEQGRCPEAVERWIGELLDYRPDRHPGDLLIASWLSREKARAVLGDAALPHDLASIAERFR